MTCRVVVSEKTMISAWSEKMVSVRLTNQGYLAEAGYIQPYPDIITSKELLVIPGIISTEGPEVHVRVANFGDQDAVFYSMTNIAIYQSIYMNDV